MPGIFRMWICKLLNVEQQSLRKKIEPFQKMSRSAAIDKWIIVLTIRELMQLKTKKTPIT